MSLEADEAGGRVSGRKRPLTLPSSSQLNFRSLSGPTTGGNAWCTIQPPRNIWGYGMIESIRASAQYWPVRLGRCRSSVSAVAASPCVRREWPGKDDAYRDAEVAVHRGPVTRVGATAALGSAPTPRRHRMSRRTAAGSLPEWELEQYSIARYSSSERMYTHLREVERASLGLSPLSSASRRPAVGELRRVLLALE